MVLGRTTRREVRGNEEVRSQKSEDRRQKTGDRRQEKTGDRGGRQE
jgi:hypothetical protein